ncbi:MAG TPA: hypothetical protein PKC65_04850 [Pyrinomonadaceae bacterium]|nr:hypothetical protein [Pyrinomonadaceae bacterium]
MLNRPPPYFPQNQLSPPDPNRYRKFKLIIAGVALGGLLVLAGLIYLVYVVIGWIRG